MIKVKEIIWGDEVRDVLIEDLEFKDLDDLESYLYDNEQEKNKMAKWNKIRFNVQNVEAEKRGD